MNIDKIVKNFEDVKNFFEDFKERKTFEEIQEKFDVDVIRNVISVKYPTYSIHISDIYISEEIINKILSFSDVSIRIEPVIENKGYVTIIDIADVDFKNNKKICEQLMQLLEISKISYERILGTQKCHYYVDVDAKGNVVGKSK